MTTLLTLYLFLAPPVRLPEVERAPAPMPSVTPVAKLTGDSLYVITGDVPFFVVDIPAGVVTVTPETGPLRIRGRFADDPSGKVVTRSFGAKYLAIVEASHTGRVELVVIPEGVKSRADILRQVIDVDAGTGPRPPPDVPPPIDALSKAATAAYAGEPASTRAKDAAALAAAYRESADELNSARTAGDVATLVSAARSLAVADRLASVRSVFGDDFASVLPSDPTAVLTPEQKGAAGARLNRYAAILEALK